MIQSCCIALDGLESLCSLDWLEPATVLLASASRVLGLYVSFTAASSLLLLCWDGKWKFRQQGPCEIIRILFLFLLFPQTIGKVLMQYADILSKNFPAYCTKERLVGPGPGH